MTTTREQLETLQKQVGQLRSQIVETRRILRDHGLLPKNVKRGGRKEQHPTLPRKRAREILRNAGMLGEVSPEEKKMAAEWRALPEERKQEFIKRFQNIRFDPPLSETIIQDRR